MPHMECGVLSLSYLVGSPCLAALALANHMPEHVLLTILLFICIYSIQYILPTVTCNAFAILPLQPAPRPRKEHPNKSKKTHSI